MTVSAKIGTQKKPVRFSYVTLKTPRAFEDGGKLNYSLQVLIPKSDAEAIKNVEAAVEAAIKEGIAAGKFNLAATKNAKFWNPLRSGDQKAEEAAKAGSQDYLKGHLFLTPKNERRPTVNKIGSNGGLVPLDLTDLDEVYSGCYGIVAVNFAAYGGKNGMGVGVYVNHVLKIEDGERLDGSTSAEDEFADMLEAPAASEEGSELQ